VTQEYMKLNVPKNHIQQDAIDQMFKDITIKREPSRKNVLPIRRLINHLFY